ncbi:MAG TPA: ABC transporter permease [Candidatus Binatia bacterium]|nr:ABC transporter permease [Candidatus Binatia bacterium]
MIGPFGAIVYEAGWLGLRSLRRFFRIPANWLGIVLFPLIQLVVFSQLYRDIVQLPGFAGETSYLAYLAPGQVAFAAFFATSWTGTNLVVDERAGYLDKLRVAPIHRLSILAGELVPLFVEAAAMAAIVLGLAVLLGAPIETGLPGAVGIVLLGGALGLAWSGTSFLPAVVTRSEQATGTLSLLFFPVAFMSTAFVPATLMPDWLRVVNDWNPITFTIEAMRALTSEDWDWAAIGRAVAALGLFGGLLQGATLIVFRRRSG